MADAWLIERSYICILLIFSSLLNRDCALCRRDALYNHVKWPQSHMQPPPCAPAMLSYDICFSSLSATIGLFVRDLALRGSDDFLVFVQCSAVQFSLLGLCWGAVLFFFFCKCFVAHKPHFPFECLYEHQSIHYDPSSALCIRRCLLRVCVWWFTL